MGGIFSPSSKRDLALTGMPPGSIAPVSVADARVLMVVLQDELDDDGLNDGVKIRTTRAVDQVAPGSEDSHHRISGDTKIAARGPHEDFHGLVENVIGDLHANLVAAMLDRLDTFSFVVGSRRRLQPLQLFSQGWYGHSSCFPTPEFPGRAGRWKIAKARERPEWCTLPPQRPAPESRCRAAASRRQKSWSSQSLSSPASKPDARP